MDGSTTDMPRVDGIGGSNVHPQEEIVEFYMLSSGGDKRVFCQVGNDLHI